MRKKLNEAEREAYRLALAEIEKNETEITRAESALREKLAPQRENILQNQILILNLLTGLSIGTRIKFTEGTHCGKSAVIVGMVARMGSMRWQYSILVDGVQRSIKNDLMPSQAYMIPEASA